jgi:hypothetical protein
MPAKKKKVVQDVPREPPVPVIPIQFEHRGLEIAVAGVEEVMAGVFKEV